MDSTRKISSIILIVVAVISVVIAALYYLGGSYMYGQFKAQNFTSLALVWTVILFLIAGVITLLFTFVNIFTNPKVLKGFLISAGLAVAVLVISYAIASPKALPEWAMAGGINPTPGTLKWVGTGLIATYLLAIVAFGGIIVSEVMRAIK